ncbi:MAG: NAD-dependent epimerase/dehydratase family protein [Bacteroidetes bacterium]|nr:NAD-dependent epimerase/dehydratase family protein [Bacteroidota bacterium]
MSFSDKYTLLTGSSGFLGTHIKSYLSQNGFNVLSLGRKNADIPSDISHEIPTIPQNTQYLIHAAGKAHSIPKTPKEVSDFYQVNHQGTLNILNAIEKCEVGIKCFIFISSVSVYGLDSGEEIDENYPLKATDPYGKSKILAENAIIEYCDKRNINYLILRLPLIAGSNPPGNLGAMIKAIKKGWYLSIGNASAKKSMVLADDVANLISQNLNKKGIYNLTDGYHPTFKELEATISNSLNKKKPFAIPQSIAIMLAQAGDLLGNKSPFNSIKLKKIQSTLTFSDKKAQTELNWKPNKVLDYLDKIVVH